MGWLRSNGKTASSSADNSDQYLKDLSASAQKTCNKQDPIMQRVLHAEINRVLDSRDEN